MRCSMPLQSTSELYYCGFVWPVGVTILVYIVRDTRTLAKQRAAAIPLADQTPPRALDCHYRRPRFTRRCPGSSCRVTRSEYVSKRSRHTVYKYRCSCATRICRNAQSAISDIDRLQYWATVLRINCECIIRGRETSSRERNI